MDAKTAVIAGGLGAVVGAALATALIALRQGATAGAAKASTGPSVDDSHEKRAKHLAERVAQARAESPSAPADRAEAAAAAEAVATDGARPAPLHSRTMSELGSAPWLKHGSKSEYSDIVPLDNIQITETMLLPVAHLSQSVPKADASRLNKRRTSTAIGQAIAYTNIMSTDDVVLGDIVRCAKQAPHSRAYVRAGPRAVTYFEPARVKAAIVTCGGLCPGLNNVIREIVMSLGHLYGVTTVYGVVNGYGGFYSEDKPPVILTPESVMDIHHKGGTVLGAARGGFDEAKIFAWLQRTGVNQVYIIGGDGTHRGAQKLYEYAAARRLPVSVIGIPKTIDNDIDIIDRSFGFNTAVQEACRAVASAKVEAQCAPNGIGIVKLMGRHAGFIAANAALASGDADLVLIPEVPMVMRGDQGCLEHIGRMLEEKGHAVVILAEGAGEELLGEGAEVDAGGNRKLPENGMWLKEQVNSYFKSVGVPVSTKYIDPSYMIRSVAANASDAMYCMLLGQNAVHGAMAGFTGFSVGLCNNRLVYLPISTLVANSPRVMDATGRTYERILSMTRQPKIEPKPVAPSSHESGAGAGGAMTARTIF